MARTSSRGIQTQVRQIGQPNKRTHLVHKLSSVLHGVGNAATRWTIANVSEVAIR